MMSYMTTTLLRVPIEIFAPGRHTAADGRRLSFSANQLAAWAGDGLRIPMVPGHPHDDQPVMGWATKVGYQGGRLKVLEAEGVDPAFAAIVNSGQLNRVSIKLAPRGQGDWSLKHIGFLGTSAPSLGQLSPAQFSTPTGELWIMPDNDDDLEFAKRELELADREAEFAAKQAAFLAEKKWTPVVAKLVAEGKVLPIEEAPLMACFARLDGGESIEFSRDGKDESTRPAEFLQSILDRAKPVVEYSEVAKPGRKTADSDACFKSYDDAEEATESAAMHKKILASGVDPKDPAAYQAAVKKMMKGGM
jgi:hypothetical protein